MIYDFCLRSAIPLFIKLLVMIGYVQAAGAPADVLGVLRGPCEDSRPTRRHLAHSSAARRIGQ